VSLSGDAGDELFCGYNRYQMTANLWRKLAAVPMPLRKLAARGLTSISPQSWNSLACTLAGLMPRSVRLANVRDKLHKGAGVLSSQSADALYLGLVSHWHDPASVVIGGHEPPTLLTGNVPALNGLDDVQRMMALDMLTYHPDDILTKVDRGCDGRFVGNAGAVSGSSGGGACVEPATIHEVARRTNQVGAASGVVPACAQSAD